MIPQSDTDIRVLPLTAKAATARFVKTKFANLYRHTVSGNFYCRAKVGGRLVRVSLKSRSMEVSKKRMDALLDSERARRRKDRPDVDGYRFKQVATEWLASVQASKDLKPRAKDYRAETLAMIQRSWPALDGLRPAAVSVEACKDWAKRLRLAYSATRFNGCVETLRGVFDLAVERGLAATNPAIAVERCSVVRVKKRLPSPKSFRAILKELDGFPARSRAALVVRFLVYSGARPAAAALVMPADVNLKLNQISLPPIKHQHEALVVPMSKALRAVVVKLLKDHPGGIVPLLPIKNPARALRTVCKELGLPRMRTYDLRHLFTTHLLESGVPVPIVASLRGDKDGGRMLLKEYSHIREAAMSKAVKKIRW